MDFEIVGITDKNQPLIYADPSMFIPMIYNAQIRKRMTTRLTVINCEDHI